MNCGNGRAQAQIGNGSGSFAVGPMYSSGGIFCKIPLLINLNGDGNLDLVMSVGVGNTSGLAVAMGKGDGTFRAASVYDAGTDAFASSIVLGDFNNDHIADVAILGKEGIWIFLGQGGGLFSPGVLLPVTSPECAALELATADVNGDGKLDLLAGTTSGFVLLLGNGDGTFQAPVLNTSTGEPGCVVAADVNEDGKVDVV